MAAAEGAHDCTRSRSRRGNAIQDRLSFLSMVYQIAGTSSTVRIMNSRLSGMPKRR